jgi:hypothetical protein
MREPKLVHLTLGQNPARCARCDAPKGRGDVGLCKDCYNEGFRARRLDVYTQETAWHTLASGTRVRWKGDIVAVQGHIDRVLSGR